jgi:hypothetical protein
MSVGSGFATRPAALRVSIREVESRIHRRRSDISSAFGSLANNIGERTISPGAIIAAGLFGVAIQRDSRLQGLIMLAILPLANAGLRLLLTVTAADGKSSAPRNHPGHG